MNKVLVSLFVFFASTLFAHEFNPAHLLIEESKELEYEACLLYTSDAADE